VTVISDNLKNPIAKHVNNIERSNTFCLISAKIKLIVPLIICFHVMLYLLDNTLRNYDFKNPI